MARFIGVEDNFNVGEHIFANALREHLDHRHIFYKNREIYGREFDFCLLIPEIGVCVIEIKGWLENSVQQVSNDGATVFISTEDGVVPQTPWKQARGYRFALLRRIHTSIGKDPLVFSMLAYPNISKDFYKSTRLDIVSEEDFTFLAEDFTSPVAFRAKLNSAIANARNWGHPDAFNKPLMYQVRSIFEGDIKKDELEKDTEIDEAIDENQVWLSSPFSCLSYISGDDKNNLDLINKLLELYAGGTKVYLIIEDSGLINQVVVGVDKLLQEKGLRRNKDKLEPVFDTPEVNFVSVQGEFNCFNFQVNIIDQNKDLKDFSSFEILDGQGLDEPTIKKALKLFDMLSSFNLHQYEVEHADSRKNILVRAGAGTGKTYAMISRIIFLCYREGIWPASIKNRFVMITFTLEAADNMKRRLKSCFQNYYLLTKNPEFIEFISQTDNMNISTIHSYAKDMIQRRGSEVGFGSDIRIRSGQFHRQDVLKEVLEEYIKKKMSIDRDYLTKLNMPMYDLRDLLMKFINQLHNKSFRVRALKKEQFGELVDNPIESAYLIHELITQIIPEVETKYAARLADDNALDLGSLISELNNVINNVSRAFDRMDDQKPKYMFIDEFQDTDDVQIDTLLTICRKTEFILFVVGDIKQCIYRFRGAEEMAFDRLDIDHTPNFWYEFVLNKNYRTDKYLLEMYQSIFSQLNADRRKLLVFEHDKDMLVSSISHNQDVPLSEFYKCSHVSGKKERLPALFKHLSDVESKIKDILSRGDNLTEAERTIAILVRENWQAEEVRKTGKTHGFTNIVTHTGGDLYQSAPAADLLVLLKAMLNSNHPEFLYKLLESNFFNVSLDRLTLYRMRSKSWMQKEQPNDKQVIYLTNLLDHELEKAGGNGFTWLCLLQSLRTQTVLQVLRNLYHILQPWMHYSEDEWHQQFYRINVDLLFEKFIESYSIDMLSVNTLADFLHTSIVTKKQDDCRWPQQEVRDTYIVCSTVHKAKGLEYGWVIMPYCDFRFDTMKYQKLDVVIIDQKIGYRIRNNMLNIQNSNFDHQRELTERMREETRILYVAMTRAIRSFSWIDTGENAQYLTWQSLLKGGGKNAF